MKTQVAPAREQTKSREETIARFLGLLFGIGGALWILQFRPVPGKFGIWGVAIVIVIGLIIMFVIKPLAEASAKAVAPIVDRWLTALTPRIKKN